MKSVISFSTIWNILSFITIIILIILYVTEINKQKNDKVIDLPEPKEVEEETYPKPKYHLSYQPGEVWTEYITKPVMDLSYTSFDITILMPIRSTRFVPSLTKLIQYAEKPDKIQVVLRCDDDDESIQTVDFKKIHPHIQVIVGPRLRGYDSAHIMYTEMLNTCSGKVLMMWNDDADIITDKWDSVIYPLIDDTVNMWNLKVVNDYAPLFPVITRKLFVKTQCYSGHYTNDTFLKDIWAAWGKEIQYIDIELEHKNDQTFVGHGIPEETYTFENKQSRIKIDGISYEEAIDRFVQALKMI